MLLLLDSEFDTGVCLLLIELLSDSDVFALPVGDGVALEVGDAFNFLTPGTPSSFSEVDVSSLFALTLLLL